MYIELTCKAKNHNWVLEISSRVGLHPKTVRSSGASASARQLVVPYGWTLQVSMMNGTPKTRQLLYHDQAW